MFICFLICLLMLCAPTLHAAASEHKLIPSSEILGACTGETRMHVVRHTPGKKSVLFTILSAPTGSNVSTLQHMAAECAALTKRTKKDSSCGQQLLKLLQQFQISSITDYAFAAVRLTKNRAHIRSCTFGHSATGSRRACAFPYSSSVKLRDSTHCLQCTDAHCIMAQDSMPIKTASEIARATYEEGKPMRIVVNIAAWREQLKKRA